MATGTLLPSVLILEHSADISTSVQNADLSNLAWLDPVGNSPPLEAETFDGPGGGTISANGTPGGPGVAHSSGTPDPIPGVGDTWYHRAHVLAPDPPPPPIRSNTLDLGNVLNTQVRNVEVWNAHRVVRELTSITEPAASQGLTLNRPAAPHDTEPNDFQPLESAIYTVTVASDEGPPVIDEQYDFNFDTPESPSLFVTGDRVVLFAHSAQRPLAEVLEFATDVMGGFDGNEQRARGRNLARQLFEMDYLQDDVEEIATTLNELLGHGGRVFGIPLWHFKRNLISDLSAGATVVPVDTTNADFRDAGLAMLWRAFDDFEVVEIDTVDPGQLNLVLSTTLAHTAIDTIVMPVHTAIMSESARRSVHPNGVTTYSLKWLSLEYTDLSAEDGDLTIYQGAPVLDDLNVVSGTLSERIAPKMTIIDSETGAVASRVSRLIPEFGTMKTWFKQTAAEAWALRRLLYALRGKQRAFWLSTFREDFVVTQTIGSSDTSIDVTDVDYERFVDQQSPFRDIEIVKVDKTGGDNGDGIFRRRITSTADLGGNEERLGIDSSLGEELTPAEIERVSYLVLSRLNSDKIRITHERLSTVEVRVPVLGVIQ